MRYRNSTPLNVILEESREPPVFIRKKYLCNKFVSRTATFQDHPLNLLMEDTSDTFQNPTVINRLGWIPLLEAYARMESRLHLLSSNSTPMCYSYEYEALFFCPELDIWSGEKLINSTNVCQGFLDMFNRELLSTICIYTDGSKTRKALLHRYCHCGYCPSEGITLQFRAVKYLSIFGVEAMAIIEALKLAKDKRWDKVTIFTDSRSVLSALGVRFDVNHGSELILKIKSATLQMSTNGKSIKLIWIPSHKGIPGNERADSLAKSAIVQGRDTQISIPRKEFTNLWKSNIRMEAEDWCFTESKHRGNFFCQNFLRGKSFPWFKEFSLHRRTVTAINRLRSDHTSLRTSLFKLKIVDSPLCPHCGEEETPNHVFWVCSKYKTQREISQKDLVSARGYLPHPVNYLLATLHKDIILSLDKFITTIPTII